MTKIEDLNIYDSGVSAWIGTDADTLEWLRQVLNRWDDEILDAELEKCTSVSVIDFIKGNVRGYTVEGQDGDYDLYYRVQFLKSLDVDEKYSQLIDEFMKKEYPGMKVPVEE